jgi:hypothetical protein
MRAGCAGSTMRGRPPAPVGDQRGAVQHDPASLAREHARQRHFTGLVLVLGGAQRAPGHREHRRWKLAAVLPVAVGGSGSQRSTPGVTDSTLQSSLRTTSPRASGPRGRRPRRAAGRAARLGEVARDLPQEGDVLRVKRGLPRRPRGPDVAPGLARRGRRARSSSWSPPIVMFACQRALRSGLPPVASSRADTPRSERATPAMSW